MVFQYDDYRDVLKATLRERNRKSPGHSLRAFAEKIGVSNSFLSEVLNKKKSLSMDLAFKIAVKLDFTETESQYLCLLVRLEHETDAEFRHKLKRRLRELAERRDVQDLSAEVFRAISDWFHFAILELTHLPGFRLEAAYVSEKLGISEVEARAAIERLLRLRMIEKDARGRYRKAHDYVLFQSDAPNAALKEFHRQLLERAIESLRSQTPQTRLSASDILPIDSKYLPQVDRLSREFSNAVMGLSEKSRLKDSVYCLSVHFFKLTQRGGALQ